MDTVGCWGWGIFGGGVVWVLQQYNYQGTSLSTMSKVATEYKQENELSQNRVAGSIDQRLKYEAFTVFELL